MLMPGMFGENLFDDFMDDFPFFNDRSLRKTERKLYGHNAKNLMKTDVKETDTGYELEMDLPGFKKDEIRISLDQGYLTISAEKGLKKEAHDKKTDQYIRKERYTGTCRRAFYVGEDLTEKDIRAEFRHGILKLLIPKKDPKAEVDETKYITIEG